MKRFVKIVAFSSVVATLVYGGGYKIPEVSTNAIALSSANVAHNLSADADYYNPANMVFMEDKHTFEADIVYVGLDGVKYKGVGTQAGVDIAAKKESFVLPEIHYVSPWLGTARVGLSVTVPGGLSKRWSASPAVDRAKEFTLEVIEVNPSIGLKITDNLAFGFGFRIVNSKGYVKSSSLASRDMQGDSTDYGYNLALSYKPTKNIALAATYRSRVNLTEEGNAKLYIGNAKVYDGGSTVAVPLPATLNIAAAYSFESQTTVELVYEKVFWSAYKTLDFNYASAISPILVPYFDTPIEKNWHDTNVFRLGITQKLDEVTLMAGMVYDKSPVSDETLSFELPDSDSISYSLGGRYQFNDRINFGGSLLYSVRKDREAHNSTIDGTFSNANVLIASLGLEYKF